MIFKQYQAVLRSVALFVLGFWLVLQLTLFGSGLPPVGIPYLKWIFGVISVFYCLHEADKTRHFKVSVACLALGVLTSVTQQCISIWS